MKRLNLGKLKKSIRLQTQTSLQLWKTYKVMRTSTGHGRLLERTSKFRPKRVSVTVNRSIIKPLFDEECLKFVDERKQAKL
jgi:hypothetical protein